MGNTYVDAAEATYKARGCKMKAAFHVREVSESCLDDVPVAASGEAEGRFQAVCSFGKLQRGFLHHHSARKILESVGSRLQDKGYFFGYMPDSAQIWTLAQKSTEIPAVVSGAFYHFEFEADTYEPFDSYYIISMKDGARSREPLVHFPSVIRLAREAGMQLVDFVNFQQLYDMYRHDAADLLKQYGVLDSKGKIKKEQMEVMALFSVFVFQRDESLPVTIDSREDDE